MFDMDITNITGYRHWNITLYTYEELPLHNTTQHGAGIYPNAGENNYTYPPGQPYGIRYMSYTGNTLGCAAILLNILFLACVCCIKDKDSAYNRFIQNLSICDILGSVTFLITQNWPQGPFAHILAQHKQQVLWIQCLPYVFRSTPWMFFTAYMLTLNCLSVSQYLASCKPHLYMNVRVNKKVSVVLLGVWLFASLQIIIPILVLTCLSPQPLPQAFQKLILISKIEMVSWMLVYFSSCCLSIVLNIIVYMKLRQLKRKQSHSPLPSSVAVGANTRAKNEAFITISCLCIASMFCRLPLPLVGMLLITLIETSFGAVVMNWMLATVVLLLYLVFVVDPVIYFVRMTEARVVLCNGLRKLVRCPVHLRGTYQGIKMKRTSLINISAREATTVQTSLL